MNPQTAEQALARHFRPGAPDDCWPWAGTKGHFGYGTVRVSGRQMRAHRLVYQAKKGPIPEGLVVRHSCDNPPCVNPDHLLLGTAKDNNRDTRERRRNKYGSLSPHARMTEAVVAELRRRCAQGEPIAALAREYGVHETTAGHAIHGRTWTHVQKEAS